MSANVKPRLHDEANTSNVGHWKHSTHRVAEARMTNGQLPTLALEGNRLAVGFLSRFKGTPNVGTNICEGSLHGYTMRRVQESEGVPAVIRGSVLD